MSGFWDEAPAMPHEHKDGEQANTGTIKATVPITMRPLKPAPNSDRSEAEDVAPSKK